MIKEMQRIALLLGLGSPHGHYLHTCDEHCFARGLTDVGRPTPDFPIRIEKVGGGASPIGYAAFVWPDELHTVALMSNDSEDEPVEAWTESDCLWRAIYALYSNDSHRLGEPYLLNFPPKGKLDENLNISVIMYQAGLRRPAAKAFWDHDIDDVCLAIENGGLES